MKNRIFKTGLFSLILAGTFLFTSPGTYSNKIQENPAPANELTEYRKWHQVTDRPVKLDAQIAVMCAPATVTKINLSPHAEKYIRVFVNPVGKPTLLSSPATPFPQGSMIIKEKLPDAQSSTPELLTAMIKREAGFNPPSNDWEFLVLSGDGKQVVERGNLQKCITCHLAVRQQDLVYRNYLKITLIR